MLRSWGECDVLKSWGECELSRCLAVTLPLNVGE